MLTPIKGYYDNGKIVLSEQPFIREKTKVIITFLNEEVKTNEMLKRKLGTLKGKIAVPDNFDEPLEDLKDYR